MLATLKLTPNCLGIIDASVRFSCLAVALSIILFQSRSKFPVEDEVGQYIAGLSHWKFGKFDFYRVTPPGIRLLSTAFATLPDDCIDWGLYNDHVGSRSEFTIGVEVLKKRRLSLADSFFYPRFICLIFWFLGYLGVIYFCQRIIGHQAATAAGVLWCFCPSLLAYSCTILPDVASASALTLCALSFMTYGLNPSFGNACTSGIWLGALISSRLNWLVTGWCFLVVVNCWILLSSTTSFHKSILVRTFHSFVITTIALLIFNSTYFFSGTFQPIGDFKFCSKLLGGEDATISTPSNRFVATCVVNIPCILPKDAVLGLDYLAYETETKKWSFLRGEWKKGGWLHYYLLTVVYKTPEPMLVLTLTGFWGMLQAFYFRKLQKTQVLALLLLFFPSAFSFFFISAHTGFNHHHRYVLFVYPSLIICAAFAIEHNRVFRRRLPPLLLAIIMGGFLYTPSLDYIGYFNITSGGRANGWKLLGHSNTEWGQNLNRIQIWLDANPEKRNIAIEPAYFHFNESFFALPEINRDTSTDSLPDCDWLILNTRVVSSLPPKSAKLLASNYVLHESIIDNYLVFRRRTLQLPFDAN